MSEEYGGILGAFPYAFGASGSRLFRSYVVVGGLVAVFAGSLFLLALPLWVADTLGGSVTLTLSRAFLVLVALALVGPIVAPILLVARHHRLDGQSGAGSVQASGFDAAMAATGYLFVASLYVGLLAAAPAGSRGQPSGMVAPIVTFLYGLPQVAGVVPPIVAVLVMVVVHRWRR